MKPFSRIFNRWTIHIARCASKLRKWPSVMASRCMNRWSKSKKPYPSPINLEVHISWQQSPGAGTPQTECISDWIISRGKECWVLVISWILDYQRIIFKQSMSFCIAFFQRRSLRRITRGESDLVVPASVFGLHQWSSVIWLIQDR